jgi:hypothetical protein
MDKKTMMIIGAVAAIAIIAIGVFFY